MAGVYRGQREVGFGRAVLYQRPRLSWGAPFLQIQLELSLGSRNHPSQAPSYLPLGQPLPHTSPGGHRWPCMFVVRVPTPLNVIPLLNLFSCPAQVLRQCPCSKATSHHHVTLFWPEMLAKGRMGSRVTCPFRLSLSPLPLLHSLAGGVMLPSILMVRTTAAPEDSGIVGWKEGFVKKRGGSRPARCPCSALAGVWCGVNCDSVRILVFLSLKWVLILVACRLTWKIK